MLWRPIQLLLMMVWFGMFASPPAATAAGDRGGDTAAVVKTGVQDKAKAGEKKRVDVEEEETEEETDEEEKDPHELAREVTNLESDLKEARMELQIADLDARIEDSEAQAEVRKAQRTLDLAKKALVHFKEQEQDVTLEEARIERDRAANDAQQEENELAELQAMYKAEEFAEMTKELVLQRSQKSLALATRDLEVQKRSFAMVKEFDLPKDLEDKEEDVRAAQEGLESARLTLEKTELEGHLALGQARRKIREAEQDLREAREKLVKAGGQETAQR